MSFMINVINKLRQIPFVFFFLAFFLVMSHFWGDTIQDRRLLVTFIVYIMRMEFAGPGPTRERAETPAQA